jgi:DNA-binding transcriptional LysR family regulator
MDRTDASDLLAFLVVARERSFTRAAAKVGMTQSALSQIIRSLEERIGVRLLNRTTRNVTPTQAGEGLFLSIGSKFNEMDTELAALGEIREKPAGIIRLTATEYAVTEILLPALGKILPKYRDIHVEFVIDYGLTNIVAQQVDAGVRPGELVAKDIAIGHRSGAELSSTYRATAHHSRHTVRARGDFEAVGRVRVLPLFHRGDAARRTTSGIRFHPSIRTLLQMHRVQFDTAPRGRSGLCRRYSATCARHRKAECVHALREKSHQAPTSWGLS